MNFIFDLGNVLVDWNPDKFIANFEIDDHEKQQIKAELFDHDDWHALDKGTKNQAEVIANVVKRSGLSLQTVNYCIAQMKLSLVTIERSATLLQKLHADGHKLYCLSNMSLDTYDYLKNREFFGYFDDIIISAKIKMLKPDREIFEYALNRFKLKAQQTVFIDDMERNIIPAQKLDIHCVHFKRSDDCYAEIKAFAALG